MFTVNKEDIIWRWHCSGVFFLYFEHVSELFLMFLLFTLKNQMFSCLLAASLFTQKLKKHLVCGNSKWLLNGNVHCLKIVCIQSYSGMYFPTFGLNTEILCILSEYRKIQNNFESRNFSHSSGLKDSVLLILDTLNLLQSIYQMILVVLK